MCKRKRRLGYVYMCRGTHTHTPRKKKQNGITIQQFKSKPLNGTACMCYVELVTIFLTQKVEEHKEQKKKLKTKRNYNTNISFFFVNFVYKMDISRKQSFLSAAKHVQHDLLTLHSVWPYRKWLSSPFRYLNSFKSYYEYYGHWIYANAINWCASVSVRAFITYLIYANRLVIVIAIILNSMRWTQAMEKNSNRE